MQYRTNVIIQGRVGRFALFTLALMVVFFVVQQVEAGPITNPGAAPFTKLAAYQGVVVIVPSSGAAVMELGNAGTDIATSANIYLRPGALSDANRDNNAKVFTDRGGAGFRATAAVNQPGFLASTKEGVVDSSAPFAFLAGRLGNGGYNPLAQVDDAGILFMDGKGFILGPWTATTNKGLRIATDGKTWVSSVCFFGDSSCQSSAGGAAVTPTLDQVLTSGNTSSQNVALGTLLAPQSSLVVSNSLDSTGNAIDSLSTYANTTGSALYAQQNNVAGYAAYLSGNVKVVGAFNVTGTLTMQSRIKPLAVNVCQIGTDTCLGRYLYTSGTSRLSSGAGVQFCYERSSDSTIQCAFAYANGAAIETCSNPTDVLVTRAPIGISRWSLAGCGGAEYVVNLGPPNVDKANLPQHLKACVDNITAYNFNAVSDTNCNVAVAGTYHRVTSTIYVTPVIQNYELR